MAVKATALVMVREAPVEPPLPFMSKKMQKRFLSEYKLKHIIKKH